MRRHGPAIDFLRRGLAAAEEGRIAAEGMVDLVDENGVGVTVEVNCGPTSWPTPTASDLCRDFAKHIAAAAPATVEEMLAQPFYADASKTVNDLIGEATASIGEKISVRRFARFVAEHGMVDTYNHMGGRIGVMVELSCPEVNDEVKALSHDLVMHIAAANPQFVRRDEVPTDNLEKEREVLTQQALNEGFGEDRRAHGRGPHREYYKEVCLLEQPFVKDPDINVTKMLGGKADVVRFVRFERGEGLEKRQDNLAADIAAEQAKMKK
ncbi:MAG: translation elongation factor Ts [Christensenellales bacterium]